MDYGMPPYCLYRCQICALAAQKNYNSLYIFQWELVKKYAQELSHLNLGKSCIRFKRLDQIPLDTIKAIF